MVIRNKFFIVFIILIFLLQALILFLLFYPANEINTNNYIYRIANIIQGDEFSTNLRTPKLAILKIYNYDDIESDIDNICGISGSFPNNALLTMNPDRYKYDTYTNKNNFSMNIVDTNFAKINMGNFDFYNIRYHANVNGILVSQNSTYFNNSEYKYLYLYNEFYNSKPVPYPISGFGSLFNKNQFGLLLSKCSHASDAFKDDGVIFPKGNSANILATNNYNPNLNNDDKKIFLKFKYYK